MSDAKKIQKAVALGSTTYLPGMEEELAKVIRPGQVVYLSSEGVSAIAGDWSSAEADDAPATPTANAPTASEAGESAPVTEDAPAEIQPLAAEAPAAPVESTPEPTPAKKPAKGRKKGA